jgi:hypothetical protein
VPPVVVIAIAPLAAEIIELKPADVVREISSPAEPLLFDMSDDPGETTNLASAQPTLVRDMTDELDSWFAEVHSEWRAVVDAGLCD